MPIIPPLIRVGMIIASLWVASACVKSQPTLVEVWRGGDDGLTIWFTEAIESAFQSSPEFTLSSGKKPGTVVVTIPTHVGWKKIDGRTQVIYSVEFTSTEDLNIGASTGTCWDDALAECAAQIVQDAKKAVPRRDR